MENVCVVSMFCGKIVRVCVCVSVCVCVCVCSPGRFLGSARGERPGQRPRVGSGHVIQGRRPRGPRSHPRLLVRVEVQTREQRQLLWKHNTKLCQTVVCTAALPVSHTGATQPDSCLRIPCNLCQEGEVPTAACSQNSRNTPRQRSLGLVKYGGGHSTNMPISWSKHLYQNFCYSPLPRPVGRFRRASVLYGSQPRSISSATKSSRKESVKSASPSGAASPALSPTDPGVPRAPSRSNSDSR